MTSIIKNLTIATAAIAVFTSPALAAATPEAFPTIEVKADGYDLASPHGVASLTRQVRSAATKLCRVNEAGDLGTTMAAKRCFHKAVADATRQIEALRLVRTAGGIGQQVAVAETSQLQGAK